MSVRFDAGKQDQSFLAGGGEVARLIEGFDWGSTPLGPMSGWPSPLKNTVALILRSPVPIVTLWGWEGIMIYNDAYSGFAGARHPKLLGSKVREGWHEIADFNDNVMKVGLAGGTLAYEDQELALDRDGRPAPVWMNLDYSPVVDEDGQPIGVIAIVVETTAKVQAEHKLRIAADALAKLNATLEQQVEERTRDRDRMWRLSSDIMLVADFNARIDAVNPAWTSMLGWAAEELIGHNLMNLVHPDDVASTLNEVGRLVGGVTTLRFENRYRQKDGGYRWLSWTAVPDEQFIHAVGRDIQAEKEQAEALRHAEEALRQSQKMEAVGQLTGGIAHDFNNLLAAISGSLEILDTRIAQGRLDTLDRYINTAQGAASRAAALTHRLLAFARRQTLDPRPTDVNRLILGMEELIRRTVGPSITVEVTGDAGLWTALIDPNQLESALLNLCVNARDAMPEGGRITIQTSNKQLEGQMAREHGLPPGQFLSLCVTDTGSGMSPDVVARAFDPFFTTKPIGQGTGLGLSMIYGFVRQSEGQVRIWSEPGMGTTICLYLPRHMGREVEAESLDELGRAPRAEHHETVLVVDDEPSIRMLIVDLLLEELGYTALAAENGASGLEVLRSARRVDLLVTDVGLPGGMNGRQLADAGRAIRPELRVLFITGYAEGSVLSHEDLGTGMQVLTKPFAMDALARRIKAMVGET
jgi:PAS domain S-box-containing protein